MIFLIDMDGVLADYDKCVIEILKKHYPEKKDYFSQKKTEFKLTKQFPELKKEIINITLQEGFIKNLEPIPGSIKGIQKILDAGHEVFICTSPHNQYEHGVEEKYVWIEKYFDKEFTKKLILTKDKTMIHGDFLIDDKPEIIGLKKPTWEHIIFRQSYNQHITNKQMISWENIDNFLRNIKKVDKENA